MDSSERLPKSKPGVNELYLLDKMAVCTFWTVCRNKQEADGWRGLLTKQLEAS